MQLIKFILKSMSIYWSNVSLLPKKVLKEVERVCKSLWKEEVGRSIGAKVKWENICRPIEKVGLGLKNLGKWKKHAWLELFECYLLGRTHFGLLG